MTRRGDLQRDLDLWRSLWSGDLDLCRLRNSLLRGDLDRGLSSLRGVAAAMVVEALVVGTVAGRALVVMVVVGAAGIAATMAGVVVPNRWCRTSTVI